MSLRPRWRISPVNEYSIERAKARDEAAWEQLLQLCSPLVYVWCREKGLPAPDAADVGQEPC